MLTHTEYTRSWRHRNPGKWKEQKRAYNARNRSRPECRCNSGKPWTGVEIAAILAPNRPPDSVLSAQLGRTIMAIQVERCKLLDLSGEDQ